MSLDDVLRICINGCELKHFNAEKKIKRWMDITNGVRHIQGYKGPSKKERLTMVKLLLVRVTPEHFILLVLKFIKYFFVKLAITHFNFAFLLSNPTYVK